MSAKNIDVYEKITAQIVAQLEAGTIPWQKTWNSSDEVPRNFMTKKPYRGINVFLLGMASYGSPYWMTFKQASEAAYKAWLKRNSLKHNFTNEATYKALKPRKFDATTKTFTEDFDPAKHKGGVRAGSKSTPIIFWKILKFEDSTAPKKKNGSVGEKTIPLLRYYNVFNVEQMDGLDIPTPERSEPDYCHLPEHKRGDANCFKAQQILAEMQNACPVTHGGGKAFYSPPIDQIVMPTRDSFLSDEDYYATRFHETVHSTGHGSRLKRPGITKFDTFGSEQYSEEELVAEMGAAMLCGIAGIDGKVIENQAAYIKGWLKRLTDDPKLLISAAGQAQRAADYILGTTFDTPVSKDENNTTEAADETILVAA